MVHELGCLRPDSPVRDQRSVARSGVQRLLRSRMQGEQPLCPPRVFRGDLDILARISRPKDHSIEVGESLGSNPG